MTELEKFAQIAAKRYLQNIVFVDDQIYVKATGQPVIVVSDVAPLVSPFGAQFLDSDITPLALDESDVAAALVEEKAPFHPKDLVQSFAREGMVCALYEPNVGFDTSIGSELFKLCERADVVILDWDLFGEDGRNILPLISNLVNDSQTSIPHQSRLGIIYTTKPDLHRVANSIYEALKAARLDVQIDTDFATLGTGATRFVVLGKPNVIGRTPEAKALEVAEENLASRVIDEFAKMHIGILPSYALYSMSSMRRHSKKILYKFDRSMDGPFLLHRALLLKNEDAFEQLPELIAEEVLAVMLDDQVGASAAAQIAGEVANSFPLETVILQVRPGRPALPAGEIARKFLGGGEQAVEENYAMPEKIAKFPVQKFHVAMGCNDNYAEKRLAALFNLRTRYSTTKPPSLGFGTIVRWNDNNEAPVTHYALCLMPMCDSIRLVHGERKTTSFPFWTLRPSNNGKNTRRGIAIKTRENNYIELFITGKPRDLLWIDKFSPAESGTVLSTKHEDHFIFTGAEKRLEWVAQLKPAHAQRAANDIGNSLSRVGVVEAEWLRILPDA